MCAEIHIYFEGDRRLKPGFDAFFGAIKRRAREKGCSLRLIDGRSGETACQDFGIAIRANSGVWNILLRDSEGPVDASASASLCQRQGWDPSHADSIFWMVEMMEAWFHADKDALNRFYGTGFNGNALKKNPNVERISKKDLEDGLREATRKSSKGNYYDHKTEHGPKLLGSINPESARKAAPNCGKLFDAVLAKLA
jgi:hypothetical protein